MFGDHLQRVLLQLVHPHEALHARADLRGQRHRRRVHAVEPRVGLGFRGRRPLGRVEGEQALDEGLGLFRDRAPLAVRELELAAVDLLEDGGVVVAVERGVAAEQDVGDHPDRPQVARFGVVPVQHLKKRRRRGNRGEANATRSKEMTEAECLFKD